MAAPASRTPRVRVAAAIPVASGLVVVRQRKAGRSYWLLPGGGVSWGESLAEALVREVAEEIGLAVEVECLLFVNDTIAPDGAKHVVNVTFLARATSPPASIAPRDAAIDAVDVVPFEQLAQLDVRPPIASELAAFFTQQRQPAAYLGPVWVDEDPVHSETDSTEEPDATA